VALAIVAQSSSGKRICKSLFIVVGIMFHFFVMLQRCVYIQIEMKLAGLHKGNTVTTAVYQKATKQSNHLINRYLIVFKNSVIIPLPLH